MNIILPYIELFFISGILPFLAFIAVFIKTDFNNKIKTWLLCLSFFVIALVIFEDIYHHFEEMVKFDFILIFCVAIIAFIIIKFTHRHNKNNSNIKVIVITEFFHGLVDGVIIGLAYLADPLLVWGTVIAILAHEAPKIFGIVLIIKNLSSKISNTITYAFLCQSGVPVGALLVFAFGFNIDMEWGHTIKLISLTVLSVVIIFTAIDFWKHKSYKK